MLRKIRTVLLLVIVVPVLGLIAYGAISQYMSGEGHLVLVAPDDSPLRYQLDGQAGTIAAGAHERRLVKQGEHKLELTTDRGTTSHAVKVSNGFAELLVPAHDDQCFVLLDVSESHYGKGHALPKIKERIPAEKPFDLPSTVYFSEIELPSRIKENRTCNLLVEAPCGALHSNDRELLTSLGFTEH